MYIEGEEIFFVDYEKDKTKILLYAPLRSYLCLLDRSIKEKLTSGDEEILSLIIGKLKKRKLIDIKELHNLVRKSTPELSIAITDNCNLKCRYCHASAGEPHKINDMSLDMISSIFETYLSTINEKVARITFAGGGEPTYNFIKFQKTVDLAKKIGSKYDITCEFRMATNGCYNDKVREYIRTNFSEVSLSFDGPDFIQNYHRPYKNGKESFPTVFKTARYFYDSKFPFAFRATVSDYSISHLTDIIDFFSINFPNKSLGLEPLNPYGRAASDHELKPPDKNKFAEEIIKAYKYSETKPITLKNAGLGKFETLRTIFCGAVGIPCWTVNTDGTVSCCSRDNAPDLFTFGKYDHQNRKFVFDNKKINEIQKMNVFNYSECNDCFCKYHCAGDCPDLRISNLHNCKANKMIGSYILNNKIENQI